MAALENTKQGESKQRKWVKIIENYPEDSKISSGEHSLTKLKFSNGLLLRQRNVDSSGKSEHQTSINDQLTMQFISLRMLQLPIYLEIRHNSFDQSLRKIYSRQIWDNSQAKTLDQIESGEKWEVLPLARERREQHKGSQTPRWKSTIIWIRNALISYEVHSTGDSKELVFVEVWRQWVWMMVFVVGLARFSSVEVWTITLTPSDNIPHNNLHIPHQTIIFLFYRLRREA